MQILRKFSMSLVLVAACAATAAEKDAAFLDWARTRIVPIAADGKAFRTLDDKLVGVKLIGVGESFHEAEPFLIFRAQLLQDLVRRHRVTALVLESGLPEVMAMDDYIRGRNIQRAFVKGPALPPPGNFASTGSMLHATLGKQYYAIATAYGGPSMDKSTPPEEGSVDAALGTVGSASFMLNLQAPSRTTAVASWLAEERPMRFQSGHLILSLGDAFDTVAYFESAKRAPRAPPVK